MFVDCAAAVLAGALAGGPREEIRYCCRVTLAEFRSTLVHHTPPDVPPLLLALWQDAKGDWEAAHRIAQDAGDAEGAWVHAYLHRKEGALSNARYWYRQAGRTAATGSLDDEWTEIVRELLQRQL